MDVPQDKPPRFLHRRRLLQGGAVALGSALIGPATAGPGDDATPPPEPAPEAKPTPPKPEAKPAVAVHADGTYDMLAMAEGKSSVALCLVQSRMRAVDPDTIVRSRRENLQHMLDAIEAATGFGGQKDIIALHEFPITGYSNKWTREQALKIAIEVPGAETEAVARLARDKRAYIIFGSYVKDQKAWPNHLLSNSIIVAPDGSIADQHWKARNPRGGFGANFELFTTTIYDVLDRYVEMYGADAVAKVTRTPVGNISCSSVQKEFELTRACALKGAELFIRTATGSFDELDMAATSMYNDAFSACTNNAYSPENPGFLAGGYGGSAVWDNRGRVMVAVADEMEQAITAHLPLRDYRRAHRIPALHPALALPEYQAFTPKYPPNLFAAYQPADPADAWRYLKDKSGWR